MVLTNMMEDRKLDFNQPFLSVRRFASIGTSSEANERRKTESSLPPKPPIPVYKSELKSGPIRNAGTVPFLWEKTPGKPKDQSETETQPFEEPLVAPKLPPGRVLLVGQQILSKGGSDNAALAHSQVRNIDHTNRKFSASDQNATRYDFPKEREDKGSSCAGDGDEVYLDAVDTLSRSESFFMSCSISGLSGLSGLDGPDVNSSRTFARDPQTRDFMMDRFLPAAKAMASETPPHPIRKQPVQPVQLDRPRELKKVIIKDKKHAPNRYAEKVLTHYSQDISGEESEDEDDYYDESGYPSAKACGFLPRFCLKSSLCLLNPVPGMRMQAPAASLVRRARNDSSCASSHAPQISNEARNEKKSVHGKLIAEQHDGKIKRGSESSQIKHRSGHRKLDQSSQYYHLQGDGNSDYKKERSRLRHPGKTDGYPQNSTNSRMKGPDQERKGRTNFRDLLACDSDSAIPVVEKTVIVDSVHKVKSPKSESSSSDLKLPADLGLGADGPDNFATSGETKETPLQNPSPQCLNKTDVAEKMSRPKSLESVDSAFLSCSDRSTRDIHMDFNQDLSENAAELNSVDDRKIELECRPPLSSRSQDGSLGLSADTVSLTSSNMVDGKKIDLDGWQAAKSALRSNGHSGEPIKSANLKAADGREIRSEREWLRKPSTRESSACVPESITLGSSKVSADQYSHLERQLVMKVHYKECSRGGNSGLPVGPPLPKSPSESWLKRTLPTISSRNPPLQSLLALQTHTTTPASKPTAMIETSSAYSGHSRFPEELLTTIPEA